MSNFKFSLFVLLLICSVEDSPAQSLSIRPKNFIVTPSTGPVYEIIVQNNSSATWNGTITPTFKKDWRVTPLSQKVELKAGATNMLSFAIEFGSDLAANSYPVSINSDSGKEKKEIKTEVVCASTPYYKAKINGELDEWTDAIPISFTNKDKKTVVRSYWNKNNFYLAVEVEEEKLIGLADADKDCGMDAIQFALSPKGGDPAARHEYLVADSASMWSDDSSYLLTREGKVSDNKKLEEMVLKNSEVKVSRSGNITTYELSIPMKPMKNLRATAGREYCFNLLVHDPDGTGVRDLGSVMNLSEADRSQASWRDWEFVQWNGYVPHGIGVEFGFCSSIH
ncbi:MAG: hypothetical protein PF904_14855 [Kiritimatiellae bacterium]|jgi:hypothetical protein|nr:hypothetical protein [Kiritimatiellia bacterium]